jgi:lipopolysaccharide/colanic/teichoic acid biosynthesis glycosyltransferase
MGMGGRESAALNSRTMTLGADEIQEENPELRAQLQQDHKLEVGLRVDWVGRFLRRWRLDELPQLVNVLKRDLSLVGSRMISASEHGEYDKWGMNLLTVGSGTTGLWQVSGRPDVTHKERVRLHVHCTRNQSILLNMQILDIQTLPAALKSRERTSCVLHSPVHDPGPHQR